MTQDSQGGGDGVVPSISRLLSSVSKMLAQGAAAEHMVDEVLSAARLMGAEGGRFVLIEGDEQGGKTEGVASLSDETRRISMNAFFSRPAAWREHVRGGEGHVRCCYATSMAEIEEALERMRRFVKKHNKR